MASIHELNSYACERSFKAAQVQQSKAFLLAAFPVTLTDVAFVMEVPEDDLFAFVAFKSLSEEDHLKVAKSAIKAGDELDEQTEAGYRKLRSILMVKGHLQPITH